jgi:hypothetical protein
VAFAFRDGTNTATNTDRINRSIDLNRSVPSPMDPTIRLAGTRA